MGKRPNRIRPKTQFTLSEEALAVLEIRAKNERARAQAAGHRPRVTKSSIVDTLILRYGMTIQVES